jgi:hypothetical protein
MKRNWLTFWMGVASTFALCSILLADPIVGRDILKFSQKPMLNTPLINLDGTVGFYNGHDELSTAYAVRDAVGNLLGYNGRFMADDFADRFSSPVVHVKWWGSYHHPHLFNTGVKKFLISFETDAMCQSPAGTFSCPGQPLLNQIVDRDSDGILTPGSGTFTENQVWPTSVDGPIYEYNAELHLGKEFYQQPDTVYWLKIVALVDPITDGPIRWGWHNRDYTIHNPLASTPPAVIPGENQQAPPPVPFPIWHFQDDAVSGEVAVKFDPNDPMTYVMPLVQQFPPSFRPERYLATIDGPGFIEQFSKDLAFELYTVPEPASFCLVLASLLMWMTRRPGRI